MACQSRAQKILSLLPKGQEIDNNTTDKYNYQGESSVGSIATPETNPRPIKLLDVEEINVSIQENSYQGESSVTLEENPRLITLVNVEGQGIDVTNDEKNYQGESSVGSVVTLEENPGLITLLNVETEEIGVTTDKNNYQGESSVGSVVTLEENPGLITLLNVETEEIGVTTDKNNYQGESSVGNIVTLKDPRLITLVNVAGSSEQVDFIVEETTELSKSTSELIDKFLSQPDEDTIPDNLQIFNILSLDENVDPNASAAAGNTIEHSPTLFVCYDCNLSFDKKKVLAKHISEAHMKIKPKNTKPVQHVFQNKSPNVDKVILSEREAIAEKGLICVHCNLIFKNKKDLRNHIVKIHMGVNEISSEEEDSENEKHVRKKRKLATTVAKRAEKKGLRASGKVYFNVKGKKVNERKRRNYVCVKCPFKCSTKFSEAQKDDFFNYFWKMGSEDKNQNRQRQYIANNTQELMPARQRCGQSRKKRSIQYFLEKESERVRVCRSFLLSIFDISEKFVRTCLAKKLKTGVIIEPDMRGKQQSKNKTDTVIEQHARQHILSLPAVESHYCRQSSKKLYLSSQLNIEKLYDLYLEKCEEDNKKIESGEKPLPLIKPVSKSLYKKFFYSYGNLTFHKPKKDQCKTCNRYYQLTDEEKKAEEESHLKHIRNKDKAREIKKEEVDKCKDSNGKRTVLNFDLQAVLECPKGSVSSIFYKRKLAVYNLTIFDLISKEGTCNLWNETEGNRGSTEIGTCIFNYIKEHPETEHFFLMSDSCGGQNLNQFFTTALLHTVRLTHCKSIDHVFYEPGHSEQEGDSMHSTIERSVKNVQINVPAEWNTVCRLARKTQKPYNVITLTHESFIDWTLLAEENKDKIRYYTTEGEQVEWRKIKWFHYEKENSDKIFFKYNYEDVNFKQIKLKVKPGRPPVVSLDKLPKAYANRLPISWEKYKDLKELCDTRVIPTDFHLFYENLPHVEKDPAKKKKGRKNSSDDSKNQKENLKKKQKKVK